MSLLDRDTAGRRVAGFCLVVLGIWTLVNWPTPLLLVAPGLLWIVRRKIPPSLVSPVWAFVLLLTAVGLVGYAIYGSTSENMYGVFQIDGHLAKQTVLIIAASTTATACGACVPTLWRETVEEARPTSLRFSGRRADLAAVALACLPLLVALLTWGTLYSRVNYLGQAEGSLFGLTSMVTVAGLVALGYLLRSSRPALRYLIVIVILLEMTILFALGTRLFAMAPVAVALGAYVNNPDRYAPLYLLGSAVLAVLLLPIPLYLRELDQHGLDPYLSAMSSMPYGWDALHDAIGNLVLGFVVTGATAFNVSQIGLDKILIELSPVPGRFSGWYEITGELRFTDIFPYSGIGELWNSSIAFALLTFFAIGIVIGYIDRKIRELMLEGRRIVAIVLFGLVFLSALLLPSYNVRNSTRPLWYAIAIVLIIQVPIDRIPVLDSANRKLRARLGGSASDTES